MLVCYSVTASPAQTMHNFLIIEVQLSGYGEESWSYKWAESAPNRGAKIHPNTDNFTMAGAKNSWPNHFVPTIGEKVYWTNHLNLV